MHLNTIPYKPHSGKQDALDTHSTHTHASACAVSIRCNVLRVTVAAVIDDTTAVFVTAAGYDHSTTHIQSSYDRHQV